MVLRREDHAEREVTLDDGQSFSGQDDFVQVETEKADVIKIFIDDGTAGNQPETYDLQGDEHKAGSNIATDEFKFERQLTTRQDRRLTFENIAGDQYRVDLTDQSGGSGNTYRVLVESLYDTV